MSRYTMPPAAVGVFALSELRSGTASFPLSLKRDGDKSRLDSACAFRSLCKTRRDDCCIYILFLVFLSFDSMTNSEHAD